MTLILPLLRDDNPPKRKYRRDPALVERDAHIILRFRAGESLSDIADAFGITRERVRQRLEYFGLDAADGGHAIKCLLKASTKLQQARTARSDLDARCFERHGMTIEQLRAVSPLSRSHHRHPLTLFRSQRNNAKKRGIKWNLTFGEWWRLWQESGKWEQRGRHGDGYVMARWGDEGPYSADNVHICTLRENSAEHWIPRRLRNGTTARPAEPTKLYWSVGRGKKPWMVRIAGKTVGCFATEAEAASAARAA